MKKQKPKKVIYYSDEKNDDFAGTKIKAKTVDSSFKFVHKNPVWRFFSFLIYYCIAVPVVWVYVKLIKRVKFVNVKAVKKCKEKYYLYGNHTGIIDAYTPNLITLPRRNKIIVSPDTVSIKGLKNIVQMLGALPSPNSLNGMKSFLSAVDYYHERYNITIYPEAHIWPYYTGVRDFCDSSFAYPVKHNAPVFAFFTAYSEPKGLFSKFKKANVTIYISNAFYPDINLSSREAKNKLRNEVYSFMLEKSKLSTHAVIEYVKNKKVA